MVSPGLSARDTLGAPGGHDDDAEERDADAEMRDRRPQAERGNPAARRSAAPSGTRKTKVRSARSISAPAMTKSASPTPNGASTGPPCWSANAAAIATAARKPQ